jgi:hypothetical protein
MPLCDAIVTMKMSNSPFEGGAGGCPDGMTQRNPPQPNGCCPPQGGIFRGMWSSFLSLITIRQECVANLYHQVAIQATTVLQFLPETGGVARGLVRAITGPGRIWSPVSLQILCSLFSASTAAWCSSYRVL